jgi:transglutaminase-like putative cysteine protease
MHFRTATWVVILGLFTNSVCLAQHLEETGRHRFVLTYNYTAGGGGDAGRFYLPVPPETAGQTIESFHSNWSGGLETNPASPAQRYLAGRVPRGDRVSWQVRIVGTFTTHQLVADDVPHPPTLPRPAQFSGASESLDWNSDAFQHWLDAHDLRRGKDEPGVTYARRVYEFLAAHGDYTYPPVGGWTASGAARRLRTDCGGFSLVFVAACRANRIPARLLVGQWLKTRDAGGGSLEVTGRQPHVIAEFFDAGIGWIPVDVSSGLTHVAGQDDYFGREPGYFFTWHYDTDFHFNVPAGADGHVQWIQNPSPWFAGDEAESGSHRWTVTPLP